jgi:hypothetical protein
LWFYLPRLFDLRQQLFALPYAYLVISLNKQ